MLRYIPLKQYSLYILFCVAINRGQAQTSYYKIDTVRYKDSYSGLSFPILASAYDSTSAKKINQYLQLSELHLLNGYQKGDIFEEIRPQPDNATGGKTKMNLTIENNDDRVFSLSFSEEYAWATMEYWTAYYNFNSRNGEFFTLKDLFTVKGYKQFRKVANERRVKALYWAEETISDKHKIDTSDWSDDTYAIRTDDIGSFYIRDTIIFIDDKNAMEKYDRIMFNKDVGARMNLSSFKGYLNNYGKSIFGITNDSVGKYHPTNIMQLYRGKVDNSSILLVITNVQYSAPDTGSIDGVYAYIKYGKGIPLDGDIRGDSVLLNENRDNDNANGVIKDRINNGTINGVWQSGDGKKEYKLITEKVK